MYSSIHFNTCLFGSCRRLLKRLLACLLLQVLALVLFREPLHAGRPRHDVYRLLESHKDILLDIWNTMLATDFSYLRGRLLVTQHGQAGPQVVLDLVVEVSVQKIDQVRAHVKVDRREYLAKVE